MTSATFCVKHGSWFCPCVRPELYSKEEKRDYLAGIDRRKGKGKKKVTA